MSTAMVPATMIAGRVDVTARALERTITAIAAHELDVAPADVSVSLSDDEGSLAASISAPIRVAPLADLSAAGYHLVDRGQSARAGIRSQAELLTGRAIGLVSVRFTKAVVSAPRRVK